MNSILLTLTSNNVILFLRHMAHVSKRSGVVPYPPAGSRNVQAGGALPLEATGHRGGTTTQQVRALIMCVSKAHYSTSHGASSALSVVVQITATMKDSNRCALHGEIHNPIPTGQEVILRLPAAG